MDTRVIRTIYADDLSTHKTLGIPYRLLKNTTLNQKFNLFDKEIPRSGEFPTVTYLALGRKGAKLGTSGGCPVPVQNLHSPKHAALFDFTPFIVRKLSDDLSPSQREKYRMRVVFQGKDGEAYVAYYLLKIDTSRIKPMIELRHIENGVITSTEFEPDVGDLTPVPWNPSPIDKNNPSGDYLVSTAKTTIALGQHDIIEIMKGFELMDGDCDAAIISEIGLVSGIDRQVNANIGGSQRNYVEVIGAQMNSFIYKYIVLDDTSTGLNISLEFGGGEALSIS